MTDEPDGRWHLDKKVSIGHIITTATALICAVLAYANLESRVAVLEVRTARTAEDIREIKEGILRIDSKLDDKADK